MRRAAPSSRSSPGDDVSVARMRERWRTFARENAMHYVAANRARWGVEAFYARGGPLAADALAWAGPSVRRRRMIDIGCGPGRMLVHFAAEFDRVDGVDIAPEMIERARQRVPANVELTVIRGSGLELFEDAVFDFAYSMRVFQHIPDASVAQRYVHDCSRVLRPGARAVLQFDTRASSPIRRLALSLPDALLPRDRRRYIRRYPVPAGWPADVAAEAGLRVIEERGPGTEDHQLLLERPSNPSDDQFPRVEAVLATPRGAR